MGNVIFIKDRKVCVKPLRSRLEFIQILRLPPMPKDCWSFAGMVNFLSMFCLELQKLIKPLYDLTRKGRQHISEKEQQETFKEIKRRLVKAPILHMPKCEGRFHLYSDTSKFATGSSLYQIQNGKCTWIDYTSKRLPEAARMYSITELELCSLAINISSFSHLLKRVDFDAIVDHLALTHIFKSKAELATIRIRRLLELISSYSFNLYYMKGKDMILSDFLSCQTLNDSNPHKIILISFNMYKSLNETYYSIETKEQYLVLMWSQTKLSGIALPEVYGTKKTLDTNVVPEKQKQQLYNKHVVENRPRLGQGRAGIGHKKPQPVDGKTASTSKSCKIPKIPMVQNVTKDSTDFLVPEQLITDKTEAITRGMIQDKTR